MEYNISIINQIKDFVLKQKEESEEIINSLSSEQSACKYFNEGKIEVLEEILSLYDRNEREGN